MFGVDAGTLEQKGQLLETILEHMEAMHEEVWNVATSQRISVIYIIHWFIKLLHLLYINNSIIW